MVNECVVYCLVRLLGPPQMNSGHKEKRSRRRAEAQNKQLTKRQTCPCPSKRHTNGLSQLQTSLKAQLYLSVLSNYRLLDKSGSNGFQPQLQMIFQEFMLGVP